MQYRREIDGLRAVAVVPVILFHAGFAPFSGGYVGVDVFFVISGYLITSILIADLEAGRFSIARFYERRARRILPALFFVMACCLPFALAWMVPSQLRDFSQALVAVSLFASNILFWQKTDYFAPSAEENPLLHTWSLAVEEQFYIVFPILLLVLWRFGRNPVLGVVVVLSLASLALSEWGWRNKPDANFYLIVTRAWELGAGAICAFLLQGRPVLRESGALSALGLGLIVLSVVAYDGETPFPSLYALAPVGGTALIILFAGSGTPVGRLLSRPAFVGIGLISYSAYLWHQPLFAFARIRSFGHVEDWLMLTLAAASLALAWFSWRYVEQPFRRGGGWLPTRRAIFVASGAGMAAFIGLGLYGHVSDGRLQAWLDAHRDESMTYLMLVKAREEIRTMPTDGACRFESPRLDEAVVARLVDCHARHGPGIALLGDSHSRGLYRGYFEEWDGPFLFGMVEGFCQPYGTRNVCDLDGFTDLVAQMPEAFSAIHFNQNGRGLLETTEGEPLSFRRFGLTGSIDAKRYRPAADRLAAVLAYISRLNQHVPVVWIGPRIEPQIPEDVLISRGCMARYDLRPGQRQLFEDLDRASAEAAATQGIGYISYISQIAATNFDMAQDFMTCEALYWIDGDHWSSAGAARFVGRMIAADALPLP